MYSGDRRVLTIRDEPGALLSTALPAARPELAAAAAPVPLGLRAGREQRARARAAPRRSRRASTTTSSGSAGPATASRRSSANALALRPRGGVRPRRGLGLRPVARSPIPTGLSDGRVVLRRLAERDIGPSSPPSRPTPEMARLVGYDDDPDPRERPRPGRPRRRSGGGPARCSSWRSPTRRVDACSGRSGCTLLGPAPADRGRLLGRAGGARPRRRARAVDADDRLALRGVRDRAGRDHDDARQRAPSRRSPRRSASPARACSASGTSSAGGASDLVYFGLLRDEWEPAAARTAAGSRRSGV